MGTEIDTAAVTRAGSKYHAVADSLGTVAGRIRGYTAEAGDFGRNYRAQGDAYGAALGSLAKAVEAWRDGARACGQGLQVSASAHVKTDDAGAAVVTGG
ncbi:hypothetical protein [Tsukamurella sp. PLM1]|uniref:hypothetical protein n=1 Tax=Tsukamurella sp. PLM1 TaxID=2929795 RepID=UPI0020456D6D|nr:hypothetical protein [Tsukamurella sp. PLM1]BDH58920.1 hypothetical protein MTP03_38590 [Tsukamurella sp. PLM1]